MAVAQFRGEMGAYVDVGAYHPMLYSNTYAFYRRGWSGLVIDPNTALRPLYKILRPRDTFIPCGVSAAKEERTYYEFADGAYNTFDENTALTVQKSKRSVLLTTRLVPLKPLAQILKEQGITKIDLLNVDAEGLDMTILHSHNWSIRPKVILVEDHTFIPDAPTTSPLYVFLRNHKYSLGGFSGETLMFKADL